MNKTILAGLVGLIAAAGAAHGQSTAFTYQGRLANNGVAVNGSNDFKFTLFGQTNGGVAVAGPITNLNVGVSNGLFTTALDFSFFGNVFNGSDRWLEIATRPAGSGAFTNLNPRQPITWVPQAFYATTAGFASAALNLTGPVPTSSLVGGYPQTVFITNAANQFRGTFTGSGGGLSNLNASQLTSGTVPDARLSPNVALLNGTNVFTGTNRFAGMVIATNAGNQIAGSGAGLFALNANNLSSGAVADARLSANVPRLNGNNEFTGFNGLNNRDLRLRDAGDQNHGFGWYGTAGLDKRFAGVDVDGPALFGYGSGVLGTMATGPKIALRWNSSGNVGIGTNNPGARLHVADTAETVAIFENSWGGGAWLNLINRSVGGRTWNFISSGSSNSEGPGKLLFRDPAQGVVMTLSTNGNVGIGTNNPGARLHVAGAEETVARFENSYVGGAWFNLANTSAGGRTWNFISSGSALSEGPGKLLFRDPAQGVVMTLSTNGNVGIGKTDPATKLDVNGTVTANQFNGPLNGSLSGTFTGGVSASSFKLGSSSTAGSVMTAIDGIGNIGFQNDLRVFSGFVSGDNGNIVGGRYNTVSGGVVGAVIGGGGGFTSDANHVTGNFGAVGGGRANSAGNFGTVPGGDDNSAAGQYSFAAGRRANANHAGTFVWADSTVGNFTSSSSNQFLIRAIGGVGIGTTTPGAPLDVRNGMRLTGVGGTGATVAFDLATYDPGLEYPAAQLLATDVGNYSCNLEFRTKEPGAGGNSLSTRLTILSGGNVGIGTSNPQAKLDVNGHASVCSLTIRGGCDLAEPFDVAEKNLAKGSVVVIDDAHPGRLKLSTQAYDTRVAGIISGANGINPGISLQQEGVNEGGENVALSGRVYVQADASNGAIKPGDLLTTSDRPGHAMKVADHAKAQGAILGKAMSALAEGTGLVLVLVTLQ